MNDQYASEDFTKEYLELSKLPEPLRLAAGLEKTMQWPLHGKAADCLRKMHAELERLNKALEQQPADEPVAWRHSKTLCLYETFEEVPLADGDEWPEALYTRPQPAAPEQKGN